MNRNMSHSLICNRGRRNFKFVVMQLTDKSPNFTEPENSELHSQKFTTGSHPKQVEPSPHFHTECIKYEFYTPSSHCTKVFQMVFPFANSPTTLCMPFSLSHAIWRSHYGGPTNPLLVALSPQTYNVTNTNYETIYSPNSSKTYEILSGVVAC